MGVQGCWRLSRDDKRNRLNVMSELENPLSDVQMQRITRALSDPQRFAILERIAAEREVACKQIVAEFPITQATISHHLKELVAADLIQSRRVGQCAMLSRRDVILDEYVTQLARRLLPAVTGELPSGDEVPPECL